MKKNQQFICLTAVLLAGTALTACAGNKIETNTPEKKNADSSSEIIMEAPETSPVIANGDLNADALVEFEPSISAQTGQAFLAIREEQGWIQYMGVNDDMEHTMLSYNAGIADIKGNGSYTVSVTTDTNGFRYDTTGKPDDDSVTPQGIQFMAVMIKDGNTLFPDAVIKIDSILVDGAEIPMTAKNYTNSDDTVELRSNIYNTWVNELPSDARSEEGLISELDSNADYAPVIINPSDFRTWKNVEVHFTVSGIEEDVLLSSEETTENAENKDEGIYNEE